MSPNELKDLRIQIAFWEYEAWMRRGNKERAIQAAKRLKAL